MLLEIATGDPVGVALACAVECVLLGASSDAALGGLGSHPGCRGARRAALRQPLPHPRDGFRHPRRIGNHAAYGLNRDWIRNLTAAGCARVQRYGKTVAVTNPRIVPFVCDALVLRLELRLVVVAPICNGCTGQAT
jgi:hypothetical protein